MSSSIGHLGERKDALARKRLARAWDRVAARYARCNNILQPIVKFLQATLARRAKEYGIEVTETNPLHIGIDYNVRLDRDYAGKRLPAKIVKDFDLFAKYIVAQGAGARRYVDRQWDSVVWRFDAARKCDEKSGRLVPVFRNPFKETTK